MVVICYTNIITDIPGFHKDMEQYEIYNNRVLYDDFINIIITRFSKWVDDNTITECAIFQNIIEELILFYKLSDDEIVSVYKKIEQALSGKEYKILYIVSDDIAKNIKIIKEERVDNRGNEIWFSVMCDYFNNSPWAIDNKMTGFEGIVEHLKHRQELELRICREVFEDKYEIVIRKKNIDLSI